MATTLTDDEIGKTVEGANGEEIGIVTSVEGDTAYVEPEPGIVDRVKGALGWESESEDTVPISSSEITEVTDDAVRIQTHVGEPGTMDPTAGDVDQGVSGEAGLDEPEVAGTIDSDAERGDPDEEHLSDPMGEIDEGESIDQSEESVTTEEMEEIDSGEPGASREQSPTDTNPDAMPSDEPGSAGANEPAVNEDPMAGDEEPMIEEDDAMVEDEESLDEDESTLGEDEDR